MEVLEKAKENFLLVESYLSEFASKSSDAIRFKKMKEDYRTPYFHDVDRIIHSLSYTRYLDKTQVYSFKSNDHISKRIVHVQFVSKIARTIGRALSLNTDLIEAISLGHDIGHTPLGHIGESFLNEISQKELGEYFCHNVQSMRDYMYIENGGEGLNLTVQTLDGILCHNGEVLNQVYEPVVKSREDVLKQYFDSYNSRLVNDIMPMTLEGCIVRIADVISYIGRDIEDAINLGLLTRDEIPVEITTILGNNNKEIINTIITDVIKMSMDKPYIKMSDEVYRAISLLKDFNYEYIYNKATSNEDYEYYKRGMYTIYQAYLKAILDNDKSNIIYTIFLDFQDDVYLKNTDPKRMVIDFIAGMTDLFFINQVKHYTK